MSQTGQELAGLNFVYPTTVIRQFLDRNNVKPQESVVTRKYAEALAQYDQKHFKHAMALFQEVNALSPGHTYVQRFITQTQSQLTAGHDRSWEDTAWIFAAAIGVGIVVLAAFGTVAIRRLVAGHHGRLQTPQTQ